MTDRLGGILLHPTSLPGMQGIGEIGKATNIWIDWLAEVGCSLADPSTWPNWLRGFAVPEFLLLCGQHIINRFGSIN